MCIFRGVNAGNYGARHLRTRTSTGTGSARRRLPGPGLGVLGRHGGRRELRGRVPKIGASGHEPARVVPHPETGIVRSAALPLHVVFRLGHAQTWALPIPQARSSGHATEEAEARDLAEDIIFDAIEEWSRRKSYDRHASGPLIRITSKRSMDQGTQWTLH